MRKRAGTLVLLAVAFALGAVAQRAYDARRLQVHNAAQSDAGTAAAKPTAPAPDFSSIAFEREPLWAYGFERPPKPGEVAAPQAPPSRKLRAGQDPAEETRSRHVEGSTAAYSLV